MSASMTVTSPKRSQTAKASVSRPTVQRLLREHGLASPRKRRAPRHRRRHDDIRTAVADGGAGTVIGRLRRRPGRPERPAPQLSRQRHVARGEIRLLGVGVVGCTESKLRAYRFRLDRLGSGVRRAIRFDTSMGRAGSQSLASVLLPVTSTTCGDGHLLDSWRIGGVSRSTRLLDVCQKYAS
jgi:hypothetical protein